MTAPEVLRAPFPYFGGKRRAAPKVWELLGDPRHYVEPFCGSMAVLLARPSWHRNRCETVNDADGWLTNTWRSIQQDPRETAYYATGPVSEVDYHAQLAWLQERREGFVSLLEGDPEFYDPKAAGWWLRVMAAGIGDPFGPGPWRVVEGRLVDTRELPHLGDKGRGVNRKLPHLGTKGRGVNRELPHLGTKGQGIENYLTTISHRLQHTRITTGDWKRTLTNTPIHAGQPTHTIGVLLDPPYETSTNLYATTNTGHHTISQDVRHWCATTATEWINQGMRIILCGYENEHDELLNHGWRKTAGAHTTGGYAKDKTRQGKTENLWLSPSIEDPDDHTLF